MRRTARTISAELRGQARRRDPDGLDRRRRHGRARRRPRGPRDGACSSSPRPRPRARPPQPLIGFLLGIAVAIVLAYLHLPRRRDDQPRQFFTVTGVLLIFVAAGILAYGVHDLQEAGDPARPQHARLRRQRRRPAGLLVRHPAQGRSSTSPRRPPCWRRRLGRLRRRRAHAVPAPPARQSRQHRHVDPATTTARPSRSTMSRRSAAVLAAVGRRRGRSPSPAAPARHRPTHGGAAAAGGPITRQGRATPPARSARPRRPRARHVLDQQHRHQGHRVLRVRRRATGSWARSRTSARASPASSSSRCPRRHVQDRLQAGHGRRRHPRAVHRHRLGRALGRRERQARRGHRRLQALRHVADRRAGAQDAGVRRRGQGAATSPGPRRSSRSRAPTGSASSRWPSPSATSTRRSTAARTTSATRASQFTGFHRLEKDLWVTGPAARLDGDRRPADGRRQGARRRASPPSSSRPLQLANGAKELLDEVATGKITGEEDRYSHTDLWDFKANVEGSPGRGRRAAPGARRQGPGSSARRSTSGSRRRRRCSSSYQRRRRLEALHRADRGRHEEDVRGRRRAGRAGQPGRGRRHVVTGRHR